MITARRDLQDPRPELGQAMQRIAELEALNQELQATNWNYMEMLGFVAHELKNALASAVLSLYTVKDGYLGAITPAQGRSLESVARSLEDLRDMIRNYLDLSRLEKGEMEITRNYFTLNARVVQPVLEELEGAVQGRRMAVENDISAGKVVYADAELLKIVYRNLLSNAIKYGWAGGTIRLGAQEDGQVVTLSVCNDGDGIAPDQIPLLFGKFSRLYNPEYADQRGTGLGLYICREIVEKHGGSIWADSRMGEWVKFSFTLPMEEAS
jgi:signal transduction histidine kinase